MHKSLDIIARKEKEIKVAIKKAFGKYRFQDVDILDSKLIYYEFLDKSENASNFGLIDIGNATTLESEQNHSITEEFKNKLIKKDYKSFTEIISQYLKSDVDTNGFLWVYNIDCSNVAENNFVMISPAENGELNFIEDKTPEDYINLEKLKWDEDNLTDYLKFINVYNKKWIGSLSETTPNGKYIFSYLPFYDKNTKKALFVLSFIVKLGSNSINDIIKNIYSFSNGLYPYLFSIVISVWRDIFLFASIKSAIAAIMSRNGSHNIGSHVLAALTHELSEVPDNQKLFQYIQQRMDFIAQITTEIPDWTYPAYVVQDIMRGFYAQKHLINKIAESEELSAYEFQPKGENGNQENKIVIKVKYNGKFVITDTNDNQESNIDTQVQVAIPGGTVGYHAFYTILENFIRNSAKHGWAKREDSNLNVKNLEITVDIRNDDNENFVEFVIYDNVSIIKDNHDLVKNQNKKLQESFIDFETGRLKYENWGLAEMKIAVGYLNQYAVEKIGAEGKLVLFKLKEEEEKENKINKDYLNKLYKDYNYRGIIRAVAVYKNGEITGDDDENKDEKINGNNYLAYQFAIPKPKVLAIIGFNEEEFELSKPHKNLKSHGIYFYGDTPKRRDFDFILIKGDYSVIATEIENNASYPIRTMCFQDDEVMKEETFKVGRNEPPIFLQQITEDELGTLQEIVEPEELIKNVYELWLKLKYKLNQDNPQWYLHVAPFENATNSQKSNILKQINVAYRSNFNDNDSNFNKIKSFFYKYEEDIETLPKIYRASKVKNPNVETIETNRDINLTNSSAVFKIKDTIPNKETDGKKVIIYKRHLSDLKNAFNNYSYSEALSGAQYSFPIFSVLIEKDKNFKKNMLLLSLFENGLFSKIAIFDERFYEYSQKNDNYDKFKAMQIFPRNKLIYYVDHSNVDKSNIGFGDKEKPLDLTDTEVSKNYIAIIIHQTILDNNFNNDKDKIEDFIGKLKSLVPYVIVTSGRGKPDKLPKNAYFIPFSSLESLLIKQYPEKLLFTKIIHRLFRGNEK